MPVPTDVDCEPDREKPMKETSPVGEDTCEVCGHTEEQGTIGVGL